ncbi:hypothetical protein FF38_09837 [Lucilia cuprina]|uniref:Uncharacterized protein n=1 Tax=Lucilia cuprina TaxID=7375 RepID=A0A0L0CME8_LUCCU|nr:hypothetical protein FF38_09837 [Lucilia cuprina]
MVSSRFTTFRFSAKSDLSINSLNSCDPPAAAGVLIHSLRIFSICIIPWAASLSRSCFSCTSLRSISISTLVSINCFMSVSSEERRNFKLKFSLRKVAICSSNSRTERPWAAGEGNFQNKECIYCEFIILDSSAQVKVQKVSKLEIPPNFSSYFDFLQKPTPTFETLIILWDINVKIDPKDSDDLFLMSGPKHASSSQQVNY